MREKTFKIFEFVKLIKRVGKDVECRKWIKGRDGRIGFCQEDRCKIGKKLMERIMIKNAWDHKVDVLARKFTCEEVREAIRKVKEGNTEHGLFKITTKIIVEGVKIAEEMERKSQIN